MSPAPLVVLCPRCQAPLGAWPEGADRRCDRCEAIHPRVGGIPCLLPGPDQWIATWKRQFARFENEIGETTWQIAHERERPGLLPASHRRLDAMLAAANELGDQVRALIGPMLSPFPDPADAGEAEQARALTFYFDLLHRDWGWETNADAGAPWRTDDGGEIAAALSEVAHVAGDGPLGRMIVLGAGGCRLPYELHKRRGSETFVLDVDVLLFAAASRIVAGEKVSLVEAPAQLDDIGAVAARRELVAPRGPVDAGTFHFVFANGLAPPFSPASFDTVLTPWFVDVASPDLRDLIGTIDRLLYPGGKWIHLGPFAYSAKVAPGCRFTAQEVLELAAQSGFRVEASRVTTAPYTLSPLNHRGRLERTLAFSAIKEPRATIRAERSAEGRVPGQDPPAWIVLPHLPVPYAQPVGRMRDDPLSIAIWNGVDGKRSIHEIARLLLPRMGSQPISQADLQDAIREQLLVTHPACLIEHC